MNQILRHTRIAIVMAGTLALAGVAAPRASGPPTPTPTPTPMPRPMPMPTPTPTPTPHINWDGHGQWEKGSASLPP